MTEPETATRTVTVVNPSGLHARPAANLVRVASEQRAPVSLRNLDRDGSVVSASGMLGVLTLAATAGTRLEVFATGDHAAASVAAVAEAIESGLGEPRADP